jgi:hypothetical protein
MRDRREVRRERSGEASGNDSRQGIRDDGVAAGRSDDRCAGTRKRLGSADGTPGKAG